MTTYAFPSLVPSRTAWSLVSNTAVFGDPLKGAVQTLARPGAKWAVSLSFDLLTDDDRGALQAFLVKLRGMENRFTMHDFGYVPAGSPGGTPLVNGASQTGTSLITDGWTISTTVLKAGDWFAVNGELKKVIADVTSDGSGNATITFEPALRASPSDGAAITTTDPSATFMLANSRSGWTNENGSNSRIFSGFTIEAIEAFT